MLAGSTTITKKGRYTVELTVRRVAVPKAELPAWKQAMADLYARLERLVEEDEQKTEDL